MSFLGFVCLLPVLSALGKTCLPGLSFSQRFSFPSEQSPIVASVWLPPSQSSPLLSVSTEELCLSIRRFPAASLHSESTIGAEVTQTAVLPDAMETEWKILALYLAPNRHWLELSVCLAYTEDLRNCVASYLNEELALVSFEIHLSAFISKNSLEVRTNEGNLQAYLAERAKNIRFSHNISVKTGPFSLHLGDSQETAQQNWEFTGFLDTQTSQYIAISGDFSFNQSTQEVLLVNLFSQAECTGEAVLTYSQTQGLLACIQLINREFTCLPWVQITAEKWVRVVLMLATASHPVMKLCCIEERKERCYSTPETEGNNRPMSANSLTITINKEFAVQMLKLAISKQNFDPLSVLNDNQSLPTLPLSLPPPPRRSLTTPHYAVFTYTGHVDYNQWKFYTFYNTHTATTSIHGYVTRLSGYSDLAMGKNFASPWIFDYYSAYFVDGVWAFPTDAVLASKGGITGSYTVGVLGYNSAGDFALTVKITCTQTSGDCYCPAGQYPNPSTSSCSACTAGDVACQNAPTQGCLQMDQWHYYNPGPFYCTQCLAGLYYDTSSGTCWCYSSCETCQGLGASDCLTCKPPFIPSGYPPSACICGQGYFLNSNLCAPCDPSCYTCYSALSIGCTACFSDASLANASPNACQCNRGYFPNPGANLCAPCDPSCYTCYSALSIGCTACLPNADLTSAAPSSCQCVSGYWPNPNASACSPCNAACQSCLNALECLTCKSNAQLNQGICECVSAFVGQPDASNCIACPQGCTSCTIEKCLSCNAGYFPYGNECVNACPAGYIRTSDGLGCEAAISPIALLIVQLNNSLTVQFDKPMHATLSSEDISVSVILQDNQVSVEWASPLFTNNQALLVNLYFAKDYIPSGTTVLLTFITPEKVTDYQNLPIKSQFLSGKLYAVGSPPSNSTKLSGKPEQIAAAGAVAANMVSSFFSGTLNRLLATIAEFQLITYLPLSPLPLPDNFASALAALNVNNLIPNPLIGILTHNYSSQTPTKTQDAANIETTLLFPNIVSFASVSLLLLFSYVPLRLGARLGLGSLSASCKRALPAFKWSLPLSIGLTLYLDVGIYSWLQAFNGSFADVYLGFSTLCAYLLGIPFLAAPALVALFIFRNKSKLLHRSDDAFNQRWGVFLSSFSPSAALVGPIYYFLFLIRRFVFALTLFTLDPKSFAVFNFALSTTVISTQVFLYVLTRRPFGGRFDSVQAVIVEGGTVAVSLLAGLYAFELSEEAERTIAIVGVWAVRALLIAKSGLEVVKLALQLTQTLRKYKQTVAMLELAAIRP